MIRYVLIRSPVFALFLAKPQLSTRGGRNGPKWKMEDVTSRKNDFKRSARIRYQISALSEILFKNGSSLKLASLENSGTSLDARFLRVERFEEFPSKAISQLDRKNVSVMAMAKTAQLS